MGESLNYLVGPNVITRNLKKREREGTYCAAVSKREMWCCQHIKNAFLLVLKTEEEPQAKECRQLLGARKDKEMDSPPNLPERNAGPLTL